jgi:O-acetyl-ADP-ribose deacetylase (regulator of RNase III)
MKENQMIYYVKDGDLLEANADYYVNAVNCVGVMGKGIAAQFKAKYPEMFSDYKLTCKEGKLRPGVLHIWKNIINFPTKNHWKDLSTYGYIDLGLEFLKQWLSLRKECISVAMPALGCGLGGLDWMIVKEAIKDTLGELKNDIYVYEPRQYT